MHMTDSRPPSSPGFRNGPRQRAPESERNAPNDLRLAVRALVAAGLNLAPETELDAVATMVCKLARRQDIPVERILILVRAEWDAADKPHALQAGSAEALRARLVSHCISLFYKSQS